MKNKAQALIQIHWTCANLQEAREIAAKLVEQKLVACANIIPHVESIYFWNGQVMSSQEVKVIFKTVKENYSKIRIEIEKSASYQVPEILAIDVEQCNDPYEEWVVNTCGNAF